MYSFPNFEPVRCSMSGSNCCFLSSIQVSQETGKVVWCSRFSLEFLCFFDDPTDVGSLISGSSAFSKSRLYICKFSVHVLLKPDLEDFEHYLASM